MVSNSRSSQPWPGRMTHPCHVHIEGGSNPAPGILLMWRQVSAGWEGWCVRADFYAPQETMRVRQEWVSADLIEPVK